MDENKMSLAVATEILRAFFMGCALVGLLPHALDLQGISTVGTASEIADAAVERMRPRLEAVIAAAADIGDPA